MSLCLHIYAGKWMSSCVCYVFVFVGLECIHVYKYITVYGVAGKEDEKSNVNEPNISRLLYVYHTYVYIYARRMYLLSVIENRFCCCIRYNIQLSLRHALFNRFFLPFPPLSSPTARLSYAHARTQNTHSFLTLSRSLPRSLTPHIHSYKYLEN